VLVADRVIIAASSIQFPQECKSQIRDNQACRWTTISIDTLPRASRTVIVIVIASAIEKDYSTRLRLVNHLSRRYNNPARRVAQSCIGVALLTSSSFVVRRGEPTRIERDVQLFAFNGANPFSDARYRVRTRYDFSLVIWRAIVAFAAREQTNLEFSVATNFLSLFLSFLSQK
jgi:predicted sugar kinase